MDGILNIYKERGCTSHDVVARLRKILNMKKIGHTGTLDPDACGVLPVCLGQATKVCDLLTDRRKTYEAVLLLGRVTDTQDAGGRTLSECEVLPDNGDCKSDSESPEKSSFDAGSNYEGGGADRDISGRTVRISERNIRTVMNSFLGEQTQVPPMYSARKVNGRKLYELAREGITVEREARPVNFYDITVLSVDIPRVRFTVTCSKGTYIRTLCSDIGQSLGCGGCMEELTRLRVDPFDISESLTLDQIAELASQGRLEEVLYPVDRLFESLPACQIRSGHEKAMMNGNPLSSDWVELFKENEEGPAVRNSQRLKKESDTGQIRLYTREGSFFGIYEFRESDSTYRVRKIFYGGNT